MAGVVVNGITLALDIAQVVIPEVVVLAKAIADLFRAHPAMTSEQFAALTKQLADDIHATNAETLQVLASIPASPPAPPTA